MTPQPVDCIGAGIAERELRVYEASVRDAFEFLKSTDRLDAQLAKSIALEGERGWLVPVSRLSVGDPAISKQLSRWRVENEHAFPTRFNVTEAGTASWLQSQVVERADRMLFMVTDRRGTAIGHIGLANVFGGDKVMELDNIVRGAQGCEPGIMGAAVRALMKWADETLWPDGFKLRALASNERAIEFYRALGFVEVGSEPLVWVEEDGASRLESPHAERGGSADEFLLTMVFKPEPRTTFEETILTSGPSISGRESWYALDAARDGWNRNWSAYLDRFESAFADYIGVEHALATSSCTGALHVALAALEIGPGDEVIVPDVTWVATANAVRYVGATPIFADIQRDSMCMDPESFRSMITERTRAVIPVHLYGHPADMQPIVEIARKAGIFIVEDAAPSIGAECRGAKTGTFGDFAAFSFQGAKLLVTGEGGVLVTDNPVLYEKAKKIWDQGRDPSRAFWIDELGLKYKMSNVQAALGLAQMERADAHVEAKRRLHRWYEEELEGIPGITLCGESDWARSIHWMNSIHTDDDTGQVRDRLRAFLSERHVDTRTVFPAISQYPIWGRELVGGSVAMSVGARGLNLPSGLWMRRDHVAYIAQQVREFATSIEIAH